MSLISADSPKLIWLNGAFGAGKTQTAFELAARLPKAHVFDPENIGFCLRDNSPPECRPADFQDNPLWRVFTYETLLQLCGQYSGVILAPMTVVSGRYYDEILGRLCREGVLLRHFILWAPKDVLLRRLRTRLEGPDSWAGMQIDRCLAGFEREVTEGKLDTSSLTVPQAAEAVAAACGLTLSPNRGGPMRRARVKLGHIR